MKSAGSEYLHYLKLCEQVQSYGLNMDNPALLEGLAETASGRRLMMIREVGPLQVEVSFLRLIEKGEE